jgi:hypothetical protein
MSSHSDDRDSSTRRTLITTMPGAVFVPGISRSFCDTSDADANESVVLDFPELGRRGIHHLVKVVQLLTVFTWRLQ